jgi:hypothetical protein
MKKSFLILAIAGFMLIGLSEIQAQTTQPKLNQVELMKQLIGSWKADMGKDTTFFMEAKPYGTGGEFNYNYAAKGKVFSEGKQLAGYDKKIDKIVYVNLEKGKDIELLSLWFTSTTKYIITNYSDIANPGKASFTFEGEFKSPNLFIEKLIINGKLLKTYTMTRVK